MAIRHKRDADARRMPRAAYLAGPLALLVTGSAVAATQARQVVFLGDFLQAALHVGETPERRDRHP